MAKLFWPSQVAQDFDFFCAVDELLVDSGKV